MYYSISYIYTSCYCCHLHCRHELERVGIWDIRRLTEPFVLQEDIIEHFGTGLGATELLVGIGTDFLHTRNSLTHMQDSLLVSSSWYF